MIYTSSQEHQTQFPVKQYFINYFGERTSGITSCHSFTILHVAQLLHSLDHVVIKASICEFRVMLSIICESSENMITNTAFSRSVRSIDLYISRSLKPWLQLHLLDVM